MNFGTDKIHIYYYIYCVLGNFIPVSNNGGTKSPPVNIWPFYIPFWHFVTNLLPPALKFNPPHLFHHSPPPANPGNPLSQNSPFSHFDTFHHLPKIYTNHQSNFESWILPQTYHYPKCVPFPKIQNKFLNSINILKAIPWVGIPLPLTPKTVIHCQKFCLNLHNPLKMNSRWFPLPQSVPHNSLFSKLLHQESKNEVCSMSVTPIPKWRVCKIIHPSPLQPWFLHTPKFASKFYPLQILNN